MYRLVFSCFNDLAKRFFLPDENKIIRGIYEQNS